MNTTAIGPLAIQPWPLDIKGGPPPGFDAAPVETAPERIDGAKLLDDVTDWFATYIACDPEDHQILALFAVHTHLAWECYTTPRILLDSAAPESGKTTVCEHLERLCLNPSLMATVSSAPLLVRILQNGLRTLLIDEVDRALDPKKEISGDLIAVLNSGYKRGATRPVLVGKGNEVNEMPTYAPAVLSGNSPRLPDDTRSRCIRILLLPDIDGGLEESDWEFIEPDAKALHGRIEEWAERIREDVAASTPVLPEDCKRRSREKWRPLARVAAAAGGAWPARVNALIARDLAEERADKEDGLRGQPPAMALLRDLYELWNDGTFSEDFQPTKEIVKAMAFYHPEHWSDGGIYGKRLTEKAMGRYLAQAAKAHSKRPRHDGPRGYTASSLTRAWSRLGIGRSAAK